MRKGILVASVTLWALFVSVGAIGLTHAGQDSAAAQARTALSAAEDAVKEAAERRALWTTAEAALSQAHAALDQGDYVAARRLADFAAEQARLGIAQTSYRRFQ
jgi:hypothetical protein